MSTEGTTTPSIPGLSDLGTVFVRERHLATLSTLGPGGFLHVVAVGFTVDDDGVVRVITRDGSQKVRNIEREPLATVAQVAGPQWLSLAGHARIERGAPEVAIAVELYARRYRQPEPRADRVAIVITPERLLGSAPLLA